MKRSQPKRDWTAAREKVAIECRCRLADEACPTTIGCDCGDTCEQACWGYLQAAHVVGRKHDRADSHKPGTIRVDPTRIIPLCMNHHRRYDAYSVDVLHTLTVEEQVQAVRDTGSIQSALRRTAPSLYRQVHA